MSPALAVAQLPGARPGWGIGQSLLGGPAALTGGAGHPPVLLRALGVMELPLSGKPSAERGRRAPCPCRTGLPGQRGAAAPHPRLLRREPGPGAALGVGTGPAAAGAAQGQRQGRDPVDGSPEGCDFRKPFAAEVVPEGQPQGVEGLVVVQNPLTLSDVGSHPPGLGARWSAPLPHLHPFRVPPAGVCFPALGHPQTRPAARLGRFQLLLGAVGLWPRPFPQGSPGHGSGRGSGRGAAVLLILPAGSCGGHSPRARQPPLKTFRTARHVAARPSSPAAGEAQGTEPCLVPALSLRHGGEPRACVGCSQAPGGSTSAKHTLLQGLV